MCYCLIILLKSIWLASWNSDVYCNIINYYQISIMVYTLNLSEAKITNGFRATARQQKIATLLKTIHTGEPYLFGFFFLNLIIVILNETCTSYFARAHNFKKKKKKQMHTNMKCTHVLIKWFNKKMFQFSNSVEPIS